MVAAKWQCGLSGPSCREGGLARGAEGPERPLAVRDEEVQRL